MLFTVPDKIKLNSAPSFRSSFFVLSTIEEINITTYDNIISAANEELQCSSLPLLSHFSSWKRKEEFSVFKEYVDVDAQKEEEDEEWAAKITDNVRTRCFAMKRIASK